MASLKTAALRGLAFAIPVMLGAGSIVLSDSLAGAPGSKTTTRPPTPVRVITLAEQDLIPRVTGYGTVAPARDWRAVARVEGEVIETAEALAPGQVYPAGTLLLRLDDSDLKLDLAQIDAQLASLDVKEATIRASLEIARADLELAQADLARQERLTQQGVATAASLEATRRQELSARAKAVEAENQLALTGAERNVLRTSRTALERDLGFVEIRAPYDLRITETNAEIGQYMARGQTLLSGEGTEAVEIAAQFPIGRIGPLLRTIEGGGTVLDLNARVSLPAADHDVTWKAEVVRQGEAIDARTQSSAIVVRAEDPLSQAAAGSRPPLRRNMFVEVTLGAPKTRALIVPRAAVAEGSALVVGADNTLEKRPVSIGFTMGDLAVVTSGLAAGDKLVVTDPTIAVPGMDVKPMEDAATLAQLVAEATGQPAAAGAGTEGGGGGGKKKDSAQ